MAYVMGNIRYVTFDVIYHKKMAAKGPVSYSLLHDFPHI